MRSLFPFFSLEIYEACNIYCFCVSINTVYTEKGINMTVLIIKDPDLDPQY
jgi:hypothetical protein